MNIAIHQVDGSMPNLALMQIAHYHESRGDNVAKFEGPLFAEKYDKIYHSKIFKFTQMPFIHENSVIGGTGVDPFMRLPSDIEQAGYSYTLYQDCDYHIGQTQRGCRFACSFCVVPKKEGKNRSHATLNQILTNPRGGRKLMLIDNDFFGNKDWANILFDIRERDLLVCFAQGLNIRLITPDQARALSAVKFRNTRFSQKYVTFAWDKFADRDKIFSGIKRCNENGIKSEWMQFFILIGYDTTPEQDIQRVTELSNIGALPFVMPYDRSNAYQRNFARWVNNRAIFRTVKWDDYRYSLKK